MKLQKSILLTVLTFALHATAFPQNFRKEKKRIIETLEKTYEYDQKVRQEFNSCVTAKGGRDEECKIKRKKMSDQDSINQLIVGQILDKYGWLSKKSTSEKAGNAFFYVIQHAPLQFQAKYVSFVDTAFSNGEINSTEYAFFVDRFKSKQGLAQIYGTQAETDNLGNNYLYPLKNWLTVDSERAKLNLPPIDLAEVPEYHLYPKQLDGDSIVLIGHIFDKTNTAIPKAIVLLNSEVIGQTNNKGFFIINIKRPKDGEKIQIIVNDKQNVIAIKGQKDFYNIYMQF